MRIKLLFVTILLALLAVSCNSEKETAPVTPDPNAHKVVVEEVIQASAYTYLRVMDNGVENWLAVSKRKVEKDAVLYHEKGLKMTNFKSRDLDRVFKTIYFVQNLSETPIAAPQSTPMITSPGSKKSVEQQEVSVTPADGGITLSQLFGNKSDYSGKSVVIRGKVVKFNPEIMGKNWVHIQDGTKSGDSYDLTVTTQVVVKVGDTVTFTGKITLNKDFGAGYKYDVIMEDAVLKEKKMI